jgi:GH24 family phage-related lysozyme (muramidase)
MDPIDKYVNNLVFREGITVFPYLDTAHNPVTGKVGRPTYGIGEMATTMDVFRAVPWTIDDRVAGPEETGAAWSALLAVGQNWVAPFFGASHYAGATNLRITDAVARQRCSDRLTREFIPGIKLDLPDFDGRPDGCKEVLVDLAWNAGPRFLQAFSHLLYWLKQGDYAQAALQCHTVGDVRIVNGVATGRGAWRESTMRHCTEVTS